MTTPAFLLMAAAAVTACTPMQTSLAPEPRDVGYYALAARMGVARPGTWSDFYGEPQRSLDESLFPKDDAVLSDSAIRRILGHQFTLPQTTRIAVLQLGGQIATRRYSDESARLNEEFADSIVAGLQRTRRVSSASILPSLLIPRDRSAPYLREAAARFQADLLLVFRPICTLLERAPIFGAPKYRAGCTVEALLLDTRSGIVPFSSVATRMQTADKAKGDFNERDAFQRAQYAAARDAFAGLITELGAFLERVPVSTQ